MVDCSTSQEDVRVSESQLRGVLEAVQDRAISVLDPGGRIVTWNQAAERINGYALADARGKHVRTLFIPEDQAAGLPEHALESVQSKGTWVRNGWRRRKDGSQFAAHMAISALRGARGEVTGFVLVTRDVTEEVSADRTRRALVDANDALSSTLDYDTTLATITRLAVDVLADDCTIDLIRPDGSIEHAAVGRRDVDSTGTGTTRSGIVAPLVVRDARSERCPWDGRCLRLTPWTVRQRRRSPGARRLRSTTHACTATPRTRSPDGNRANRNSGRPSTSWM